MDQLLSSISGNPLLMVVVSIIIISLVILLIYGYLKGKSIEAIREDVYQLFVKAEHLYNYSGAGKEKMIYVITVAHSMLPKWLQLIVTPQDLQKICEAWFRGIKDLLDDGKMNRTGNEEEQN